MVSKIAVCVITRKPNKIWMDFLSTFTQYDVYVMVDDNTAQYAELYAETHPTVKILQIDNEECRRFYYTQSSTAANLNEIISWDKAMFYFKRVNAQHEHVWMVEDDVFILSENTLVQIDSKYPSSDLLTPYNQVNYTGEMYSWNHWVNVRPFIELPWCRSMICACRLSRRVYDVVDDYLQKHHRFFFIESMFNTLAYQNLLKIDNPPEMEFLHFDTKWDRDEITPDFLYHPFKQIEDHEYIRSKLNENK